MKVQYIIIISLILMVVLSSCNGLMPTIRDDNPPTSDGKTVIVTPDIEPTSAVLQVGDTLEVQIPTIPSEGYEWVVTEIDLSILEQVGSAEYKADTSPDSAGGIVTFMFTAVGKGQTSLVLEYVTDVSLDDSDVKMSVDSFGVLVDVE